MTIEEVYEAHFDFLHRVLRHLGVPADSVDDAMQELLMVVHRKLSAFDGRSPRAWLFAIAANVAREERRAIARIKRKQGALAHEPPPPSDTPADLLARREAARLVSAILGELEENRREIFVLVELEEFSVVDAAEALGVNVNTAHARLRAAREDFEAAATRLRSREAFQTARGGA